MVRAKVESFEILDQAAQAIVDQVEYYRLRSPGTGLGQRWEQAVTEVMLSLRLMPERGAKCQFRLPELQELRRLSIPGFPHHLLFYVYEKSARRIRIIHVLHGARNLGPLFDLL
ncbi:type II toxin-antitoxin system RelE/ParE family toxin [Edaphobacter sp. 12200R-103]|jgi:plasmid stabilization system protein ParE|uniref:type II toxin-antitoxin system RelE/ParE family toxin n=1 Tax=Edaphobacter sp. 12200R-103 TaxID=2703788 RepID=UPI00138C7652|nr:type II toxin-antitoxin system RelE/ParE family toxin [Edaphobacter sp. 12200R-103]QHS52576.1 type II toxin-antitoxin system RelE/ParE family toxin [Edaphobacter sp. 12200R-103]